MKYFIAIIIGLFSGSCLSIQTLSFRHSNLKKVMYETTVSTLHQEVKAIQEAISGGGKAIDSVNFFNTSVDVNINVSAPSTNEGKYQVILEISDKWMMNRIKKEDFYQELLLNPLIKTITFDVYSMAQSIEPLPNLSNDIENDNKLYREYILKNCNACIGKRYCKICKKILDSKTSLLSETADKNPEILPKRIEIAKILYKEMQKN